MSIKIKVAWGVIFLFLVIVTIGGLGLYYLETLSNDSENILTDNYETLEYTKSIVENCDSLKIDSVKAMNAMAANLKLQEANVTEKGERELTLALRVAFERLKNTTLGDSNIVRIRSICLAIQDMNMKAIIRKNEVTQKTATKASTYLIIIGSICTLAAFTFIINFPGYIANPIVQLTSSIKSIARKNYEERLHFDRKDEFEELAEAFNQMAEKLDEYEHSNLAKILFEKKRIETIINRMTDPVIGLDEHDKVIFANEPALNLLNLSSNDVMDRYAPDIAVNNDLFRSLIRQSPPAESALVKAVIGGKENYFSKESITIHHTPTGETDAMKIGQVILLKNITSYKELDLAKTNFIATISHELKTPIASLQMCTRLLQDKRVGELNEEQLNIIHTLDDEVTRLSKITNELLDLSQVETGNIKLNIRKADAGDIIHLAAEAVKFQAERKHVAITVAPFHDIPSLQADLDKTTWVLVNFLTNAIRYSPENETVTVRCKSESGAIIFSVEDHGPGIEEKYLNRIFEKFFQVPGTPSGTGLGLAISKEFIEAQGGKIKVESHIGKGSVFSFELLKS
ncbi:Signal transduction histidine kinase [Chryseolinea serpens]|uniref:histidine kinase n=1 Tax=Chryseolinea serpens TaxID=947013 RepID=A0A1M5SEK7_9BACT|nr:ATP-binding protein [Chryseolinea serpens]SHH37042.1 Signal transduction histidine kinase [Chryseolinea serpens]